MLRRITALALAALVCVTAFFGCAAESGAPAAVLLHDGEPVKVSTIMTVGDWDISLDLYRYYFCNLKDEYAGGDKDFWTENLDLEASLLSETAELLRAYAAVRELAKHEGIEITEADEKAMDSQRDSTIDTIGGLDNFTSALKEKYMTEEVYRQLLEQETLRSALENKLCGEGGRYYVDDTTMRSIVENEFVCVKHIFIPASENDAEKTAQAACDRAKAGEDFDTLITEFMGEEASTEALWFGKNYMVKEFEEAARAVETGGVSDVITTSYGCHVIKRLPLDENYIEENIDNIASEYMSMQVTFELSELAQDLDVTTAAEYAYIGIDALS